MAEITNQAMPGSPRSAEPARPGGGGGGALD